jgi:hypothetical protein
VPALVISSVSIPLACGRHPPSVDKIANQHPVESANQRGEPLFALMEVDALATSIDEIEKARSFAVRGATTTTAGKNRFCV